MAFMINNWTKKQKRRVNKVMKNKINNPRKAREMINNLQKRKREKCVVILLLLIYQSGKRKIDYKMEREYSLSLEDILNLKKH